MRAVWLREVGPPAVLAPGDAPDPTPGPGQVLVDVAYAGITFVETQLRAGTGPFALELPVVPGNGAGGIVAAVGPGVDERLLGRRVVTPTGGSGAYAERAVADAGALVEVPPGVALDTAVALLADGRTAILLADQAAPSRGDRVLVEAAAGGVGSLLVQIARARGATVVATAGGPRKLQVARELGADVVADHRRPDWPDGVRAAVGGVDVVFDGVGGGIARAAFELLGDGGRILSFGLASGQWADISAQEAATRGVTLLRLDRPTPAQARGATAQALAEAAAGRLRAVIGARFPLERAADAHAAIEARATVGKTLLEVRPVA